MDEITPEKESTRDKKNLTYLIRGVHRHGPH